MPIVRTVLPERSKLRLDRALDQFSCLREKHSRWMNIRPSSIVRKCIFYPHPLYNVRLLDLLAGKPFALTLKRVAWVCFLRDSANRLACAEQSTVAGAQKYVRLTEGQLTKKVFALIARTKKDARIRQEGFELRAIRIESLHFICLWLRSTSRTEYFVPITPLGAAITAGRWISRKELAHALSKEANRVRDAHDRVSSLLQRA